MFLVKNFDWISRNLKFKDLIFPMYKIRNISSSVKHYKLNHWAVNKSCFLFHIFDMWEEKKELMQEREKMTWRESKYWI